MSIQSATRDDVPASPFHAPAAFTRRVEQLGADGVDADYDQEAGVFTLYLASEPASLSAVLPILHSLGFEVLDERPYSLRTASDMPAWVYEFRVVGPLPVSGPPSRMVDAFLAIWRGLAEVDAYNVLVSGAGITWREAALLRAYGRFLKQAGLPYGHAYVAQVLQQHATITRDLVSLFFALLDPATADADRATALDASAELAIGAVPGIDDDRVLRAYLSLVRSTVRTNYFMRDAAGSCRAALSLKFDARTVDELPEPRPMFEVFVHGPHVEGSHLRFGRIARGGLRWSDRTEDYRTEVLGLVRAQTVKNAVIVPAGAKGVFIVKAGDPEHSYRTFVASLLDITDNIDPADGAVVAPERVVRRDQDDPYLVVAADRGTATFSDLANKVADDYGFWLGDAFASGGSVGYDHKAMGITAKGAWESVKRHFRELGIDVSTVPVSAVGIGDMSGDVFGNGMLLSRSLRLVAAFDHRHIFLDPDPDPDRSFDERSRLFDLRRSTWADYSANAISEGGGVWPRTAKSIPLSPQARAVLGLDPLTGELSSHDLVKAILRSPVDLLWNGGIGTYIKAADETHLDVGDKVNDAVRVDATELRARVIAEGGNLGITPRGRIEFATAGGRVNSDAWDNSAGVDCSDHEVNIKILLNGLVANAQLDLAERNQLLASMTDEVEHLVLAENRAQNELLGTARTRAGELASLHGRLIMHLAMRATGNSDLTTLPTASEMRRRTEAGAGLTSPELASLAAAVKLDLKRTLTESEVLDTVAFDQRLLDYFPRALSQQCPRTVLQHPLRREILATVMANEMVDLGGISFVFRIAEVTGASTDDIVRAYAVAGTVFDIRTRLAEISDGSTPVDVADALTLEVRRLLERATRWMLIVRAQPLDVDSEVRRYRDLVRELSPAVSGLLRGADADIVEQRTAQAVRDGATESQARTVMTLLHQFCLLDVIDLAEANDQPASDVAGLYYALNAHLNVDHLLTAVSGLPFKDRWEAQARLLLRSDIYRSVCGVCSDVLADQARPSARPVDRIAQWEEANAAKVDRSASILKDIAASGPVSITKMVVAVRQLCSLANGVAVPAWIGDLHERTVLS